MLQDELLHLLVSDGAVVGVGTASGGAAGGGAAGGGAAGGERGGGGVPYAQLVRLRSQLQRPSTEWSLDLGGSCTVRREGDLLRVDAPRAAEAAVGDAADGSLGGGRVVLDDVTLHHPAGWEVLLDWEGDWEGDVQGVVVGSEGANESVVASAVVAAEGGALHGSVVASAVVRLPNVPASAELELRLPQAGDRFQPAWREAPTSLVR